MDPFLKQAVDLRGEYARVLGSFPVDRAWAVALIGQTKYTQIAIELLWIKQALRGAEVLTPQQMQQLEQIVHGRDAAVYGRSTNGHAGGLGEFLVLAKVNVLGEELIHGQEINITSRQIKTLLGVQRAYQKSFSPYLVAADQTGQQLDEVMHAPPNGLPINMRRAEMLVRQLADQNAQVAALYTDAQIKRSTVLTATQWQRLVEIRAKQARELAAVPATSRGR